MPGMPAVEERESRRSISTSTRKLTDGEDEMQCIAEI